MDTSALIFIVAGALTLLIVVMLIAMAALFLQMRNLRGGEASRIVPELAVLGEKLSHLEPVLQNMSGLQSEMRGISERISAVETNQGQVQQGVAYLANNAIASITELKTLTGGLNQATGAMRDELARAKNDLSELHAHVRAGLDSERQTAESIRRLRRSSLERNRRARRGKICWSWYFPSCRLNGRCVTFGLGASAWSSHCGCRITW